MRANGAVEFARELGLSYLVTASIKNLAVASLLRPQVETGSTPTEHASVEYNRAVVVLRNETSADDLANLMAADATVTEDEAILQAHALA